jgi:hypothetical protein
MNSIVEERRGSKARRRRASAGHSPAGRERAGCGETPRIVRENGVVAEELTKRFGIGIDSPPGDGWVRLPVEKPKRRGLGNVFRGRDSDLTGWADATARELTSTAGNSDADPGPDALARYTELLTDLTVSARERDILRSYAWVPRSMQGALIAKIDISTIRWSSQGPELTLDALEEMHATRDENTVELEVTRTQVPAGPAIRSRLVQGIHPSGDTIDPWEATVSITYAIRPPAIRNAVVYVMSWVLADDFPALTETAGSLVKTLIVATDE